MKTLFIPSGLARRSVRSPIYLQNYLQLCSESPLSTATHTITHTARLCSIWRWPWGGEEWGPLCDFTAADGWSRTAQAHLLSQRGKQRGFRVNGGISLSEAPPDPDLMPHPPRGKTLCFHPPPNQLSPLLIPSLSSEGKICERTKVGSWHWRLQLKLRS